MTPDKRVEEWVEFCAEVCDSVEFLHGVPVKLPSETKALLRGRVRQALAQYHQDMISEVVWNIGAKIEEANFAEKVAERTGDATAVHEVQEVVKQIQTIIKSK